jgi:hypothetical protein
MASARHEKSDASAAGIAILGLSLVIGAILMHLSLGWMLKTLKKRGAPSVPAPRAEIVIQERIPPGTPRLQVAPRKESARYLQEQNHLLSTYGWIDSRSGTVRIPIDRAIDLMIEGAPARSKGGRR